MFPEAWSPAKRCYMSAHDEDLDITRFVDAGPCMPFVVHQTMTFTPGETVVVVTETIRCIRCDYEHTRVRPMELRDMEL